MPPLLLVQIASLSHLMPSIGLEMAEIAENARFKKERKVDNCFHGKINGRVLRVKTRNKQLLQLSPDCMIAVDIRDSH